jgi:hypothetical protein
LKIPSLRLRTMASNRLRVQYRQELPSPLVSLLAFHLAVARLSRCCCVSVRLYFSKLQYYHLDNYGLFIVASFTELQVQASVQLRSPSGNLAVCSSYSLALLPFCLLRSSCSQGRRMRKYVSAL